MPQKGGGWKKCRNTSSFSQQRSVNYKTRLSDKRGAKCAENCVSKVQGSVKGNSGSLKAGSYFYHLASFGAKMTNRYKKLQLQS